MRSVWTEGGEVRQGTDWPDGAGHVWVDVDVTEEKELRQTVERLFSPHPLVMERLLENQRPRAGLRVYPGALVATLIANLEGGARAPLHIAMGRRFLLTAHRGPNRLVDHVWPEAIERSVMSEGAELALYLLLRRHLRLYRERERTLVEQAEEIHRIVLSQPHRNLSQRILDSHEGFLRLSRRIRPELPLVELLASQDLEYVDKSNRPYLEDLADDMKNLMSDVETSRQGLSSTISTYASAQSNQISKVMKVLTIISMLALPPTTVASVYGMNFKDIPELTWSFGYWYSLGLMAAITLFLIVFMRIRGWFR